MDCGRNDPVHPRVRLVDWPIISGGRKPRVDVICTCPSISKSDHLKRLFFDSELCRVAMNLPAAVFLQQSDGNVGVTLSSQRVYPFPVFKKIAVIGCLVMITPATPAIFSQHL